MMYLFNKTPFIITSNSPIHEWIRTTIPIKGLNGISWLKTRVNFSGLEFAMRVMRVDLVLTTTHGLEGRNMVGFLGSNGFICHNTQEDSETLHRYIWTRVH